MPTWAVVLIGASAVVVAASTLWVKVFRPLAKLDRALPVLFAMSDQFRTDSGSSLKDQVNRLESALDRIEKGDAVVAQDLAATHGRADQVGIGHEPGAAADAAARNDVNKEKP